MLFAQREQCFIIDAHAMIYRAIFRWGTPLHAPSGEVTTGTLYFVKMLKALLDEYKPAYCVLADDVSRKDTFRRALFPEYKTNRVNGHDEEVFQQVLRIKELVQLLGLPLVRVETFEADDIIASLCATCASDEVECVIISRDKDMHQLITPNVCMYNAQDDVWVDEKYVRTKWGVAASEVVEVQLLMGDSVDNIPGVKGVGAKKATELIQEYGCVPKLMANLDTVSPNLRGRLEGTDLALMRQLVTLRTDVPLSIMPDQMEFNGLDYDRARPVFRELGFMQFV